jgi:hypothetical protein
VTHLPLPRVSAAAWLCAVLTAALVAAACGEPPQKELDQAQAAIEVAVSAGAERYAAAGLTSARTALVQARDAVSQRDYKLALSHALDSREKAQAAARAAADARTALRVKVDAALIEVAGLLDKVSEVLADGRSGLSRARLRRARAAEATLTATLQEARAAAGAQDYEKAEMLLASLEPDVDALLDDLQGEGAAQSSRRKP